MITLSFTPAVPSRHETTMSVPGPRSRPVGSQLPSGNISNPFAAVGTGSVSVTGAAGVPARTNDAGDHIDLPVRIVGRAVVVDQEACHCAIVDAGFESRRRISFGVDE